MDKEKHLQVSSQGGKNTAEIKATVEEFKPVLIRLEEVLDELQE